MDVQADADRSQTGLTARFRLEPSRCRLLIIFVSLYVYALWGACLLVQTDFFCRHIVGYI